MKWIKSKSNFRNPKIYQTTARNKEGFEIPKWGCWILLIIIISSAIGWFIFYSDYFKVKKIDIDGTLNPTVKQEISFLEGKNIILLAFGDKEQEILDKQSSIKTLEIVRGIPNTLKVKVEVRDPEIAWKTEESFFYIDSAGIVFSLSSEDDLSEEEKNNLIVVIDTAGLPVKKGTQILTEQFVNFVKELKEKFENYTGAKIQEIKIGKTTFQLEAVTDKNFNVLFDTTREIDPQLTGLQKIIKEHISEIKEYIDMRVEGKAYYK